jgi:hypothetical protein
VTHARIFPPPGKLIDLTCVPAAPAPAIVALFRTLWPVVRPLGVDVVTSAGNWHLRGADAPVAVGPRLGIGVEAEEVPALEPDALAGLLARVDGELETVAVFHTRARRAAGDGELELYDGEYLFRVPVERRADGAWVSGPFGDVPAPMTLTVHRQWDELTLRVAVNWSLWSVPDAPEHAELTRSLRALLDAGWRRTQVDDLAV